MMIKTCKYYFTYYIDTMNIEDIVTEEGKQYLILDDMWAQLYVYDWEDILRRTPRHPHDIMIDIANKLWVQTYEEVPIYSEWEDE